MLPKRFSKLVPWMFAALLVLGCVAENEVKTEPAADGGADGDGDTDTDGDGDADNDVDVDSDADHELGGLVALADDSFVLNISAHFPAVFGDGDEAQTVVPVSYYENLAARFDAAGSLLWAGKVGDSFGWDVDLGPDGTLVFPLSWTGSLLAGYDADATKLWETYGDGYRLAESSSVGVDGSISVAGAYSYGDLTIGDRIDAADAGVDGGPYDGETVVLEYEGTSLTGQAFVARFDADADLAWARRTTSVGYSRATTAVSLPDGSVIVAGIFGHSITFAPGEPGEVTFDSGDEPSGSFIARYGPDGDLLWADGPEAYGYPRIVALSDASVVVLGVGCPISRYGADGTQIWSDSPVFGSTFDDLVTLPDDSVVWVGHYHDELTIETDEGPTTLTEGELWAAALLRYNADGSVAWARRIADFSDSWNTHRITRLSDGSLVVVGLFTETATIGEGSDAVVLTGSNPYDYYTTVSNGYLARFTADGELIWARMAIGTE